MVNFLSSFISLSVTLLPAVATPQGLGPMCYICIEDSVAISGGITTVATTTAVATLLAATEISAQAAADLNAALAQSTPPPLIYVATYDSAAEDPTDALAALIAAGIQPGVIAQESRTDANNALVGAWLDASTDRRWRRVAVLQSAEATLLTSGRPAALADCEVPTCVMVYHSADAQPCAAALAGVIAGHSMATRPLPLHVRVLGVTLPTITEAQLVFAKANGVSVLVALGPGATSSQYVIDQTLTYDGTEAAPAFTLVYAVNRMIAALNALTARITAIPRLLRADAQGAAEVTATLSDPMAQLAAAGHFVPGTSGSAPNEVSLPDGYQVVTTPVGTELNAAVLLRLGPEVTRINLAATGEIVTGA